MSNFKVGDRVWTPAFNGGWGTLQENPHNSSLYRLHCDNGKKINFLRNGRIDSTDIFPVLFYQEIKLEDWPNPPPAFKKDDPVMIRDGEIDFRYRRYYSHYDKEMNLHYVYKDGKTSWSAGDADYNKLSVGPYDIIKADP